MQVDISSLQDFLNGHWLFDNTGHQQDIGYQAALQSLGDWFDLDVPEV